MARPPPVEIPEPFGKVFNVQTTVYCFARVEKLTRRRRAQKRYAVVTGRFLLLCDASGDIRRAPLLETAQRWVCCPPPPAAPTAAVLQSQPGCGEPSLLVRAVGGETLQQLVEVVTQLRRCRGHELDVCGVNDEKDLRVPEFGPWEKPPNYLTPRSKMALLGKAGRALPSGVNTVPCGAPPPLVPPAELFEPSEEAGAEGEDEAGELYSPVLSAVDGCSPFTLGAPPEWDQPPAASAPPQRRASPPAHVLRVRALGGGCAPAASRCPARPAPLPCRPAAADWATLIGYWEERAAVELGAL
eukprot:TRINITY_DN33690_c0_g1_i1.p1 TRINITY_DN33690_c0_g1~~TRINITY_DN33690_c0_g1_i1.p1  ORF type:complete len:328 (+),score=101.92 TRINITY_DN33690_c0_g1_i1:85-984(+)